MTSRSDEFLMFISQNIWRILDKQGSVYGKGLLTISIDSHELFYRIISLTMMLKQKMNNLLKCDFGGLKTPNDERNSSVVSIPSLIMIGFL